MGDDRRWPSLFTALEQPNIARLVRSIHLSTTRFDHNAIVLQRCTQVQVLVQPELPNVSRMYAVRWAQLPPLPSLRRLYWIKSLWSLGLLRSVLSVAPNLEHLSLSCSSGFVPKAASHTLRLKSLALRRLGEPSARAMLGTDLTRLTRLTIDPAHLACAPDALPALHTLALVAPPAPTPTTVPFPAILARCPNLHELRYDARSQATPPVEAQVAHALVCVRLRCDGPLVLGVPDQAHVVVLCGPAFGALERVVLEGPGWGCAKAHAGWPVWTRLRARGCRVDGDE